MYRSALKPRALLLALAMALIATATALAGGFYVSLAQPDPRMKHAVLLVQAGGCVDGSTAQVSVTAEGIVNGERRSIPVAVTRIRAEAHGATYAVRQQWPKEGAWVLVIRGTARHTGNVPVEQYRLLAWEPAAWKVGVRKDLPARMALKKPAATEIEAMLGALSASARGRAAAR